MVFLRYFFRRYAYYTISIALLITTLLTLIELVEKLMRVSHAKFSEISIFLSLYSIPVFFDSCALAGWLSTGLLLREFVVHHEWELMMMLNINGDKLIRLFFFAGFVLMLAVAACNEFFVSSLAFRAEQFKMERFKRKVPHLVLDRWIQLQDREFCFIGVFDSEIMKGKDMTIFTLSKNFSVDHVVFAESFSIDPDMSNILIEEGVFFDVKNKSIKTFINTSVVVPQLNPQLRFNFQAPTIFGYYSAIVKSVSRLPKNISNKLLSQLFRKIFSYIQICMYPLLSVVLFILLWTRNWMRWLSLLISYPFFLLLDAIFDFLIAAGASAWLIPLFYGLFLIFIFFLKKRQAV